MNLSTIISKNQDAKKGQKRQSFLLFIKENRRLIRSALIGCFIQFILFKGLYPFADFFSDSYSYIFAAQANLDVNIWPIGYSKFLRLVHFITTSDTALIAFQYFFLELCALYFFLTILYFYKPLKANRRILFVFLFFNPLFLYICNYVNSDPLFIAISLLWFTELLWIMNQPNLSHIIVQALLLFAAFTVRNNAYIYPFITLVAFALSKLRLWQKISGVAIGLLLMVPFIIHTRNAAFKMTGTKQFSLFTGWQLANNALYAYEYMDTVKVLPKESNELDQLTIQFYSSAPENFREDYLLNNPGNFFIQYPYAPLKVYFNRHYRIKDDYSQLVAWGKASVVFEEYGKYLILHNKRAYFHIFMVPNLRNYFIPFLEKLSKYNLGRNWVEPIAQQWFHYKNNKVYVVSNNAQGIILYIFPCLFLIINAYWLLSLVRFWIQEKYRALNRDYNKNILLVSCFFWGNLLFSVFATIIVMRYQVFPMIISVTSVLLITEWLEKEKLPQQIEEKKVNSEINQMPMITPNI